MQGNRRLIVTGVGVGLAALLTVGLWVAQWYSEPAMVQDAGFVPLEAVGLEVEEGIELPVGVSGAESVSESLSVSESESEAEGRPPEAEMRRASVRRASDPVAIPRPSSSLAPIPPAPVLAMAPPTGSLDVPPPAFAEIDADWCGEQVQAAMASLPEGDDAETFAPYFFVFGGPDDLDRMPLKSTHADVEIAGVIAEVTVSQVYRNDGERTLEAMYLFPASTRAAVHAMTMTVGDRVIEATIREREEAREEYEQAIEDGKTASLLEQQRPNVFQMMVGNILPGDEVTVELVYSELIVPEEGAYEFVYPTVVGPRYTGANDSVADGPRGWTAQPTLHEGEDAFHATGIDVALHSGIPLAEVFSPSHEIAVEFDDRARNAEVHVARAAEQGNRDFVLQYRLAGDGIQSGLMLYPGEDEGFFLLMVEPPERVAVEQVVPREYVFILDVSGSMHGFPLDVSKSVMKQLLPSLRPEDEFNVLLFAGNSAVFSESGSVTASPENIRHALGWIDTAHGSGGTELLPAMQRVAQLPRTAGMSRILVVATDGYVTVERQTFDLIRENLSDANLFSFGIGSGVNRFLIEGMAHAGRGEPFVALDESGGAETAERFVEYVSSPVLQGVDVAFHGVDAYDVEPEALPDLFAARPVVVYGKYRGRPTGRITVSGHVAGGEFEAELDLSDAVVSEDAEALRYLWARERVRQLADLDGLDGQELHKEDVTRLGLDYHLLTDYTSFVAVDRVARADEVPWAVDQPLPLPQGVSDLALPADPTQHASIGAVNQCTGGGTGLGGLGTHGSGMGGGGSGYGIGAAGLGSKGASGYGTGGGYFGRKSSSKVASVSGEPIILGSIDRASIERVIKRHLNQIRYCYQRELQKDQDLAGKITVKFVIAADGTVASAQVDASTLNNPVLERCVVARFTRMKFAAPAGGGVVIVRYPIVFSVAEET